MPALDVLYNTVMPGRMTWLLLIVTFLTPVVVAGCGEDRDDPAPSAVVVTSTPTPKATPTLTPLSPSPVPTVEPTPFPTPAPTQPPPASAPARLRISKIGVDAAIVVKGVDANRTMESPDGPWDVVWYDFSGMLGGGSNAVFAGCFDFVGVGPAVFWSLRDLAPGDIVEAVGQDGASYLYSVVWSRAYPSNPTDDQLREIVNPTPVESVTLLTPTGAFDPNLGEYNQRLVVRAERIAS